MNDLKEVLKKLLENEGVEKAIESLVKYSKKIGLKSKVLMSILSNPVSLESKKKVVEF